MSAKDLLKSCVPAWPLGSLQSVLAEVQAGRGSTFWREADSITYYVRRGRIYSDNYVNAVVLDVEDLLATDWRVRQ